MSDFEQFMQQPFVGPVMGMLCFFGFLLIVVIGLLIYVRRRKAQQRAANTPDFSQLASDSADLPDMDALMSDLPAALAAPNATSAPPAPAAPAPVVPAPVRAARKGTFTVTINDGGTTEAVEVMTVLRDVVDGKLVVQMGDKVYQNINTDADFKERFTRLMRELAQVARPASEPPRPVEPPPADPEAATPAEPPAPPPMPPHTPPPPAAPAGEMPGDLPKFSLDEQGPIKPARGQKREAKPVPEINIAGAIEAYLQHKLHFAPQYDGRSIHIYPSPDGGVSIEVDGQYYESVGDVADPAVRDFLQNTIQEWQDRH